MHRREMKSNRYSSFSLLLLARNITIFLFYSVTHLLLRFLFLQYDTKSLTKLTCNLVGFKESAFACRFILYVYNTSSWWNGNTLYIYIYYLYYICNLIMICLIMYIIISLPCRSSINVLHVIMLVLYLATDKYILVLPFFNCAILL